MASLVRRLVSRSSNDSQNLAHEGANNPDEEILLEDDEVTERPYMLNSIYYLAVILLIGIPMWFYTCSSTRYPLPDLTQLEAKLVSSQPRLHLDISVVQLSASNHEKQSDYLRNNLPEQLETSMPNLVYNINWRIRRPTQDENIVIKSLFKNADNTREQPNTNDDDMMYDRQATLAKLEENLSKIHKPSNRFRLFMYLFEEPLNSLICTRPNTYLINFERFIYLCPDNGNEPLANLIREALRETYYDTVDPKRIKKILSSKTDLLVSLIPESDTVRMSNLSVLADKVHAIHEKNVKNKYLELPSILNIRLITQYIFDLLHNNALDKMIDKRASSLSSSEINNINDKIAAIANPSVDEVAERANMRDIRVVRNKDMGQFFHEYETRLSKHSTQSVHHVVTIVPEELRGRLVFEQTAEDVKSHMDEVNLLEERDTNFILIGDNDKSLVLGLRAIVRRVLGLRSANLCTNCLIRRDVFLNKWELDAIVGALTLMKLQSVLVSLKSISQQSIGIKIPAYVSRMVFEAHSLAHQSLGSLDTKKSLEAYDAAHAAYELSETAFYDPSLLETLYFPDETKYAIYFPLFLPLTMPIVTSILRLAKYLFQSSSSLSSVARAAQRRDKQQ